MNLTLQARLVRYFEKHPHTRFSKSHIINVATANMKVSPESVGRRLRVLAEVSEWGYRPNVDTPEHESGHKLLDGGKVLAERIGGLVHYTFEPSKTKRVRRVVIENGVAREIYETIENV